MNREILFRGKRVDNGEWVYGHYCGTVNDGKYGLIGDTKTNGTTGWHIDIDTLSQFTGLTDKNGVKIWEGDRLRIPADLWIGDVSVGKNKGTFKDDAFVEYYGGSFRINQIGNDSKLYYGVIDMSRNTGADVVEVIGTIHDSNFKL